MRNHTYNGGCSGKEWGLLQTSQEENKSAILKVALLEKKREISTFAVAEAWCSTDKTAVGCTKLSQITCSSYIMSITVHEGQRWGHSFYLGLKDGFKLYC